MTTQTVDFQRLTPRECEVLQAMVDTDGSNAAIAEQLGIAPNTVSVHVATIMLRTDLHSRLALAVAWVRNGGSSHA